MSRFKPLFIVPAMLMISGCLDSVSGYYGPASIAYELPSEQLGDGEHGMPSALAHTIDGQFTDWEMGSRNWTREWSESTRIEIPISEEINFWVLFDRSTETKTQHILVLIPWEFKTVSGDCGVLLRGSSENTPETRVAWAGLTPTLQQSSFGLLNDGTGDTQSALGIGFTPLVSEQQFLMAEFAIPDSTGIRKWTVAAPEDDSCEEYLTVGGFETTVSSESGYHTLKPLAKGSVAAYAPVWVGAESTDLLLHGNVLEAAVLSIENPVLQWFTSDAAFLSPWLSESGALENVNLTGRIEALPFLAGLPASQRLCMEVPPLRAPLNLDGVFGEDEYKQATAMTINGFRVSSRFNGEEHVSWVTHPDCAEYEITGHFSLVSPLAEWFAPSAPLEADFEETAIARDSGAELRSWRGKSSGARSWNITCIDSGNSVLVEHGNHPSSAWVNAGVPGPAITDRAISWDDSILTLGGSGFGDSEGTARLHQGGESSLVPIFEWSDTNLSVGLPAELSDDALLRLATSAGDIFSVAL